MNAMEIARNYLIPSGVRILLEKRRAKRRASGLLGLESDCANYWTKHNISLHCRFSSPEESLEYFHWRNDQYYKYIDLMPVKGQDGKAVLDFGCGPGHDLVGFGIYSKPSLLVGADVSSSSLSEAESRLKLHGIPAKFVLLDPNSKRLPFDDASFDHIHSSGVLHHIPDPVPFLKELRRVLKPGGSMNVMVYNYDSVFLHLHVAYIRSISAGLYPGLGLREQFAKSTDGDGCPVSNCYKPEEWIAICKEGGFNASLSGVSVSVHEASLCWRRFDAIRERRLPAESRQFLLRLEFDSQGLPIYDGVNAGIDACYRLS